MPLFSRQRDVSAKVIAAAAGGHLPSEDVFLAYQRVSAANLGPGTKILVVYPDGRGVLYTRNSEAVPDDDETPDPKRGYYLLPGKEIVSEDNGSNLGSIVSVAIMAVDDEQVHPWVRVVGVVDYDPSEAPKFGLVEIA